MPTVAAFKAVPHLVAMVIVLFLSQTLEYCYLIGSANIFAVAQIQ